MSFFIFIGASNWECLWQSKVRVNKASRTHRQIHRRHTGLCRFGQTSQWECVWAALWSVHQTPPLILLCARYKIPHTGHWQSNDSLLLSPTHNSNSLLILWILDRNQAQCPAVLQFSRRLIKLICGQMNCGRWRSIHFNGWFYTTRCFSLADCLRCWCGWWLPVSGAIVSGMERAYAIIDPHLTQLSALFSSLGENNLAESMSAYSFIILMSAKFSFAFQPRCWKIH